MLKLETSKSRLKEFRTAIDATNEWMDETEKLLKSFNVGMDPEEASKLQEKSEVSESIHPLILSYLSQLFEENLGQLELSPLKEAAKTRPASTPDRMFYTDLLKKGNKSTLY